MSDPTTFELNASLAALQMGIQTEIDGHKFYQDFAARTDDPNAQAMFERLARDEVMHLELLRNTKALLEKSGEWAEHEKATPEAVPGAPIFSRERVQENIVAYTSDLSALRTAYLIEKDAIDFYTRAAGKADDPNARQMFLDLAEMERGHLNLLKNEYDFMMDQFQMTMGFAPF